MRQHGQLARDARRDDFVHTVLGVDFSLGGYDVD